MGNVVSIEADGVTFTNFTLGHTGQSRSSSIFPCGIFIWANEGTITRNIIYDVHGPAIAFPPAPGHGNKVIKNIIMNCTWGASAFFGNFGDNMVSSGVSSGTMPSPFHEITLLEGDDVLNVTRTEGASFGDLVLKDNATLVIDNFRTVARSIKAYDAAKIILINGSYFAPSGSVIFLHNNASMMVTNSSTGSVACTNSSSVVAINSRIYVKAHGNSSVEMNDCGYSAGSSVYADDNATVSINRSVCSLEGFSDNAQVFVSNSSMRSIDCIYMRNNSKLVLLDTAFFVPISMRNESSVWFVHCEADIHATLYDSSNLWVFNASKEKIGSIVLNNQSTLYLINSAANLTEGQNLSLDRDNAKILYGYYLSVHAESKGNPLENMSVEIYSNETLVDQGITNSDGNVQFILLQRICQNGTDEYPEPNTIRVNGEGFKEKERPLTLDSNTQVRMIMTAIPVPPDVPPFLTLELFVAITAISVVIVLAIVVYKKKQQHR